MGIRWRSVGAIFLGFFAVFVLSLGTDEVLHLLNVYPPWGQAMSDGLFVLATAYRLVYGVVGGYVTARFAPRDPMKHALALGIFGLVPSIAGAVATWNVVPSMGPHWYPVLLVLSSVPCAWLGGFLHQKTSAG